EQPVILANGDIVVGDASGKLHRLDADGKAVWDPPVDLGAAVHAPMVLTDGTSRTFLVATDDGKLHALDDAGAPLWSGPLTSGPALGPGNLYTPPGARRSIAYFGGADGKLYAVLVEGWLDTSAPWPKAWHDARNTSRAGGEF
ncbi:MAG TPA: PQQ-binding-like beta-propeller repeat protein, partial [Anaeromyxobacteraceae bacterium]|nr:PQQ-binding-like beta-propeller repeat protein [Anaeromyxobacteraceae bacterium]